MQYFDIILFALIAVFLVLRLRSMLGGRDGFDGKPRHALLLVIDMIEDDDAWPSEEDAADD